MPRPRHKCDDCGQTYSDLAKHYRYHPHCQPPFLVDNYSSDDDDYAELPEASLLSEIVAVDERHAMVGSDLSDLRFEHGLDGPGVAFLQECVSRWMAGAREQQANALKPLLRQGVSSADVASALEINMFARLETPKQVIASPLLLLRPLQLPLRSLQTPLDPPHVARIALPPPSLLLEAPVDGQ